MEKLKNAFSKLSMNEKYNQISNELIIIGELIKNKENALNIPSVLSVKNYTYDKHNSLNESEMLEFLYEDIYNIQRELITLFSVDTNNDK